MIKRIFTALALVFAFSASALSADYDLLVPSKEGGGIFKFSNVFNKQLNEQGFNSEIKVKGNCVNAMADLRRTDRPSIMVYVTGPTGISLRKGCNLENEQEFDKVYSGYLLAIVEGVCTLDQSITVDSIRSGKEYTVGTQLNRISNADQVFDALRVNKKYVTYENSGKVVQGLIGKDVDLVYTNIKDSKKITAAGGKCLFMANSESFKGLPSVNTFLDKPLDIKANYYWVLSKNLSDSQKQKLTTMIEELRNSKVLKNYADKNWMMEVNADVKEALRNFVIAEKQ